MRYLLAILILTTKAYAANPFEMGQVDFFGSSSLKENFNKKQKTIDWREPIVGQDGKVGYYTPPLPVLSLLNDPSEKNARAYIEWQNEKVKRMMAAQEAVNRIAMEKQ